MKRNTQMLLVAAAMLFGAGAAYAFAEEEDHNHSGSGGECGDMANFVHGDTGKYRHGGASVATPSGYNREPVANRQAASQDSRDYYEKVEYWEHHEACAS